MDYRDRGAKALADDVFTEPTEVSESAEFLEPDADAAVATAASPDQPVPSVDEDDFSPEKRAARLAPYRRIAREERERSRKALTELAVTIGATAVGLVLLGVIVALIVSRISAEASADQQPLSELSDPVERHEIPLGSFSFQHEFTGTGPVPGDRDNVQIIEFEAAAVVQGSQEQVLRFESYLYERHHRVGEAIDIAVRRSNRDQWLDPDCRAVRGLIRAEINSVLNSEAIDDVHFSSLRTFEVPHTIGH
ncbi:hypothetical protein [Stratiformator vulcanicus]|uniref:Flagellar protein FliL n=1 Tax=Stratiformator vulcanicus TaxID=2527980 RepID=A0A517R5M8_9PLAN|nr:hypothetical protein [Stratiformator vulcanicus]QDT39194.1 hypothetical protein Pan189_35970 [Stratiformator vulcanicus]